MSQELVETAVKNCLRATHHPIAPIDLIDFFEIGAAEVKTPKLRKIIWDAVGGNIRKAIISLVEKEEVVIMDDLRIALKEDVKNLERTLVLLGKA